MRAKIITGKMQNRVEKTTFSFLYFLVLSLFTLIFLYGGKCKREVSGPIEIMQGDTCDYCKMHISDIKFAGEYILKDGRVKKFDDLGCLALSYASEKDKVKEVWVKDFETQKWLKSDSAIFVSGFTTPMAFGFVALSKSKKEERPDGISFDEFVSKVLETQKSRSPMKKEKEMKMEGEGEREEERMHDENERETEMENTHNHNHN